MLFCVALANCHLDVITSHAEDLFLTFALFSGAWSNVTIILSPPSISLSTASIQMIQAY